MPLSRRRGPGPARAANPPPAQPAPATGILAGRLKLKHLALFAAVCDTRTVRKAAEASNMTQPAATKLVQELEAMVGAQLFVRDRRGMHPTAAGELVRRHAAVVLADIANMRHEVALSTQGISGRIRLGIISSVNSQLLAASVRQVLQAWPNVRLTMRDGAADDLLAQLARNELDLAFGRVLDAKAATGLRVVEVYTESFDIVCAARHPLARRRAVPWPQLVACRWALPVEGSPLRELADHLFTRNGVLRPVPAVEYSSFEKLRYLVGGTDLVGILPRSIALQGRHDKDLALLRSTDREDFAPICLFLRQGIDQPPLVEDFVSIVREAATALKLQ